MSLSRRLESGAALRSRLRRVMITAGEAEAPTPAASEILRRARALDATMILLREKQLAHDALVRLGEELVRGSAVPVVIAHDAAAVAPTGAAGVHLGVASGSVAAARAAMPEGALVGASAHDAGEIRDRAGEGADYLMFGPVRATPKGGVDRTGVGLEALATAASSVSLPLLAVGGLGVAEEARVLETGAAGWAAIRAFLPGGST